MSILKTLGIDMTHSFPDIPRVYTALAEWLACIVCIAGVKRRLSGVKLIAACAATLVVQAAFLALTDGLYGFPWFLCMAAAIAIMYLFIYLCCDMGAREVGYYCVHAFVAAEFAASLEWQVDYFFYYDMGWRSPWFRLFWLVVIYGLVFGTLLLMGRKLKKRETGLHVTNRELGSTCIIGLAVFLVSNLGFAAVKTPFTGVYDAELYNVRTIVDLGGLAILYAFHVQLLDMRVSTELERIRYILHHQTAQYRQSQEVVDMVNYKYHDLKNHILALKAGTSDSWKNDYLDELAGEIRGYEARKETGNEVLDTLLTAKDLYCINHGITMTSAVDGAQFAFMDVTDICSIFGNALDNAIECEEKISERDKRLIHVRAYAKNHFLFIRFENYCEDEIHFEEKLPRTTKEEQAFHGYGLKSLAYTVRKYGGELDVGKEGDWFHLNILIPLDGAGRERSNSSDRSAHSLRRP